MGEAAFTLTAPMPIGESHDVQGFSCGEVSLDDWLKRRARDAEGKSARTFVVCNGELVAGYYCLAAGGVDRDLAPKSLQRNMPSPLPVLVLGRLAVDSEYQGHGIGSALLQDAILRTFAVSQNAGTRALLVHALSDPAKQFYLSRGFVESPIDPLTVMLPMKLIEATIAAMTEGQGIS